MNERDDLRGSSTAAEATVDPLFTPEGWTDSDGDIWTYQPLASGASTHPRGEP